MVFSIKGEERAKKILLGAYKNNRIPNAYIFSGQNILEMSCTAWEYAKLIIDKSNDPASICKSNIEKDVHPDFITINPDGKFIKIDQIKMLKDLIKYGPSSGDYLVVRIIGADAMNAESANSFLKILEEPADKVLFILITSKEDAILKTIISRCQKIIFTNMPEVEDAEIDLPKDTSIPSALKYSKELSELPDLEKRLYKLAQLYCRDKTLNDRSRKAYSVLNCVKAIKRNANIKLALDVMCIGGINNG